MKNSVEEVALDEEELEGEKKWEVGREGKRRLFLMGVHQP